MNLLILLHAFDKLKQNSTILKTTTSKLEQEFFYNSALSRRTTSQGVKSPLVKRDQDVLGRHTYRFDARYFSKALQNRPWFMPPASLVNPLGKRATGKATQANWQGKASVTCKAKQ